MQHRTVLQLCQCMGPCHRPALAGEGVDSSAARGALALLARAGAGARSLRLLRFRMTPPNGHPIHRSAPASWAPPPSCRASLQGAVCSWRPCHATRWSRTSSEKAPPPLHSPAHPFAARPPLGLPAHISLHLTACTSARVAGQLAASCQRSTRRPAPSCTMLLAATTLGLGPPQLAQPVLSKLQPFAGG